MKKIHIFNGAELMKIYKFCASPRFAFIIKCVGEPTFWQTPISEMVRRAVAHRSQ
jgi:hypothetical protein